MKKIINGRRYDTETAKKMAYAASRLGVRDFGYWEETLYRKQTGEFFIYGYGGPASRYAQSSGLNSWTGGDRIMPLTLEEAQRWAEEHLDGDEYEEIFGPVEETGTKKTVVYSLSEAAIEKVTRMAAEQGTAKSAIIEALIEKA